MGCPAGLQSCLIRMADSGKHRIRDGHIDRHKAVSVDSLWYFHDSAPGQRFLTHPDLSDELRSIPGVPQAVRAVSAEPDIEIDLINIVLGDPEIALCHLNRRVIENLHQ